MACQNTLGYIVPEELPLLFSHPEWPCLVFPLYKMGKFPNSHVTESKYNTLVEINEKLNLGWYIEKVDPLHNNSY